MRSVGEGEKARAETKIEAVNEKTDKFRVGVVGEFEGQGGNVNGRG